MLKRALERARELLPAQRPLESFVHHNTLHAFEGRPFRAAVLEAAELFGSAPFMAEKFFQEAYVSGRIHESDVEAVLADEVEDEALLIAGEQWSLRKFVKTLLIAPRVTLNSRSIVWHLHEGELVSRYPAWLPRSSVERFHDCGPAKEVLPGLWRECVEKAAPRRATRRRIQRVQDYVKLRTGTDIDARVHPFLIRWVSAYLDNGFSAWPMQGREKGFFRCALEHWVWALPGLPWTALLRTEARSILDRGMSPGEFVLESLETLSVGDELVSDFVLRTLLALPGWAGMFVQLNERPDLAPGEAPPTDLIDFLAIRMFLELLATRHALGAEAEDWGEFSRMLESGAQVSSDQELADRQAQGLELFQACLIAGVIPRRLKAMTEGELRSFLSVLDLFGDGRRRLLWQLAYERRYRIRIFDALLAHQPFLRERRQASPLCQVACCIDDREESFRRHLEEIDPAFETYGVAGFFGIAIYFESLGEAGRRPLCPPTIVPGKVVKERRRRGSEAPRGILQRAGAALDHRRMDSEGALGLVRGTLAAILGWGVIVPTLLRHLLSRGDERIRFADPDLTLTLDREPGLDDEGGGPEVGLVLDEMVALVADVLKGMGLVRDFAGLVVFFGHGSSSANNPHEAAYNCGACGGGRGGVNARLFAQMANRPAVREGLAEQGIEIPGSTWFVGGYHNTGNDGVVIFDRELIPAEHTSTVEALLSDLEEVRRSNAHERCRRFLSAPLDLSRDQALAHVSSRCEDLSQPRPECGHATNALSLLGRRAWSRGLFLDRRAFLTSYDPAMDSDKVILAGLLASVAPVGAGINLEYYFSFIDPRRYGCGTKLPHNVTGLLGVVDGSGGDLRTGLPRQMVELHEPMRLLNVVEATPEQLTTIMAANAELGRLIRNRWVLVAAFDPKKETIWFYDQGAFREHQPEQRTIPVVKDSRQHYLGRRENLSAASVKAGLEESQ